MDFVQAMPLADTWGMHGDDFGWGWMLVMMIPMLLFWGAIIFGVFWLVRGSTWGRPAEDDRVVKESPVEILERRFAEGAITPEDYQARREVLMNGGSSRRTPAKQNG